MRRKPLLGVFRAAMIAAVLACLVLSAAVNAQVNVTTYHNDNFLNGHNANETILTPSNVNATNFGKLFSYPVDGYVYAQPLYLSDVKVNGKGKGRNVVYVATEHDSVYAFDADGGGLIWQRSFIFDLEGVTPVPQPEVISADIVPEVGITGTPVIDATTGTLYVVPKTKEVRDGFTHYVQRLWALDVATGEDVTDPMLIGDTTIGGPDQGYTNITPISVPGTGHGSSGGIVRFNALRELQRPALTLSNGIVYVAWASHGDNGPYHGWVVGFDANTLQILKVFNTTPNGGLGGIWQSGGGLAVDPQNNLYFATGNGPFNAVPPGPRALGAAGGGMGYAGISNSVAIKFDAYKPSGNHSSTGLYVNGQEPTNNPPPPNVYVDLAGTGIDFNAAAQANPRHVFEVTLAYNGTTLTETIRNINTSATFNRSYTVNIAQFVGTNTAHVGFTGGTGGLNAQQDILNWTYAVGGTTVVDHSAGFASHADLTNNGNASFPGMVARITPAANGQAGSVFTNARVDITNFTTTFRFQMGPGSNPIADGITFTIQGALAGTEYGDSVLKLSTSGQLAVADFFTPWNQDDLNRRDADLGSGGTMLLPDQPGPQPHLMLETGKEGKIYLINRDDMGRYQRCGPMCDDVVQVLNQGVTGVWGNPSFFLTNPSNNSGIVYYHGSGDVLKGFQLTNGRLNPTPMRGNQVFGFSGGQPVVSSNGTTNGIVWDMRVDAYASRGPAILYAYNATNLQELYNSAQTGLRDQMGGAVKFTVPTVANGKVYCGTQTSLDVFGLFPPADAPPEAPSDLTAEPVEGGTSIVLSWTNNADNATGIRIVRSTDGVNFTPVNTVPRDATSYTDTGLTPSTLYFYQVIATNQAGDSKPSNTVSVRTRIANPVLQIADICVGQVDLEWTPTANDHYTIERSTDGTNFTEIAMVGADVTRFSDTGLQLGTYFYRVTAFSVFEEGEDSATSNTARATLGPVSIDHSMEAGAFANHDDMVANGRATFSEPERLLRLTSAPSQAGSAFTVQRVGVRGFTTRFSWRIHEGTQPNPSDGFTFTIQTNSSNALGPGGGGLGYGPDQPSSGRGIRNSVAIKFDTFNNAGEGPNSTGIFSDGRSPTVRGSDLPPTPTPLQPDRSVDLRGTPIELRSQSPKEAVLTYDGTTLTETITDLFSGQSFTVSYQVDIAGIIGSDTAYVGFTGGTGGTWALQDILSWTYEEQEESLTPRTPGNLRVIDVTPRDATHSDVTIAWKCNNAYTAQGFRIERSMNGTDFVEIAMVDTTVTTYTDQNLSAGTYYYRVRSFNESGNSRYSNVDSVIVSGTGPTVIDHSGGFASHSDLTNNGTANYVGSVARLTTGGGGQAGSIFSNARVPIRSFSTTFQIQMVPGSNPMADGMTFTIQGNNPTALGPSGGGLGYGPDHRGPERGIRNSVAIKFDLYSNEGEGINSTGIFTDGRAPTLREAGLPPSIPDQSVDLSGTPINLHSQHPFNVSMTYNGTTLSVTITDTVTMGSATQNYTVDIPSFVGGNIAYVGFTAGTGGLTAVQDVRSWRFQSP